RSRTASSPCTNIDTTAFCQVAGTACGDEPRATRKNRECDGQRIPAVHASNGKLVHRRVGIARHVRCSKYARPQQLARRITVVVCHPPSTGEFCFAVLPRNWRRRRTNY